MSKSKNLVILIGNLGKDPVSQDIPTSGDRVTNFGLATSEEWTDRDSGEKQQRTEWHRVVFYRGLAEIAGEYLRSGSRVYVEGKLRTRKWQDKDGKDQYVTEVIGEDLIMLGDPKGKDAPAPAPEQAPAPARAPAPAARRGK